MCLGRLAVEESNQLRVIKVRDTVSGEESLTNSDIFKSKKG